MRLLLLISISSWVWLRLSQVACAPDSTWREAQTVADKSQETMKAEVSQRSARVKPMAAQGCFIVEEHAESFPTLVIVLGL